MNPIRSAIVQGQPYALVERVVRERVDRHFRLYIITDQAGDLYAFARLKPALDEWDRLFPRALAQQEAA